MMAVIFKALFLYFLFLFVRSVWRGYRMVEEIKSRSTEYSNNGGFQSEQKRQSKPGNTEVLEAEYRVLDKDDSQ